VRTITSSEVPPGFEPGNKGFADPCLTTWPRHRTSSPGYLAQTRQKAATVSGTRGKSRTVRRSDWDHVLVLNIWIVMVRRTGL